MFLGILSAIGGVISVGGTILGAFSQADAARKDAEFKNQQANEMMARQIINEQIIRQHSERVGSQYQTAFGATGKEGGGIGGLLQIKKDTDENIALSRRDANFKARMLREGADQSTQLASDIITSGYLSGAGTLLTGAGVGFDRIRKYSGPSDTPKTLVESTGV